MKDICPNLHTDLLRILFTENSLKMRKGLELFSRPHFSYIFLIKISFVMLHKLAKDSLYFTSYSVKWVSCFMLRHYLMTLWHLNIRIQNEFFLINKVLSLRLTKQTSKNVADTTFQKRVLWLTLFSVEIWLKLVALTIEEINICVMESQWKQRIFYQAFYSKIILKTVINKVMGYCRTFPTVRWYESPH